MNEQKTGEQLIAAERQRQIDVEGYTPDYDHCNTRSELWRAALCYEETARGGNPSGWPWPGSKIKASGNPARDYTKAGALYLAEADRLRSKGELQSADICVKNSEKCARAIDYLQRKEAV